MQHIQFCLDEIACEVEALGPIRLRDCERSAIGQQLSSMRMLLASCAARQAALALAMRAVNLSRIDDCAVPAITANAETEAVATAAAADIATIEAQPEPSSMATEALPPPIAPIPAPIRIVTLTKAAIERPAAEPQPAPKADNVIALQPARKRADSTRMTRIAASLLIVVGLSTGAGLQHLPLRDPLVAAVGDTLTQRFAEGHATLLDMIEAGRRLMSRLPDFGGQKASS